LAGLKKIGKVSNLGNKAMHFIALYSRHWDWKVVFQTSHCVAYGKDSKPCFEIYVGKKKSSSLHIALASSSQESQESVDNFYKKALSLGARL
jgi:hypothetical protein